VVRIGTLVALATLLISCQNESHPAFSPAPSPSPHISPAAAILQSSEVPTGLTACVGSNQPVDVYASVMNGFDIAVGRRLSGYWEDLVAEGAESGSVSVYASDPASCAAELGAGNASAIASVVIRFADDGQADRAWQAGLFGFIPPAPAQLQAGMTRGAATGLGLSSFTYERPTVRLATWRRGFYVALVIATNLDLNTYKAATALINARLN
jgi:hypothetical protein